MSPELKPAPSAEPPQHPADLVNVGASTHEYWVSFGRLRDLLLAQGLTIVPVAEVPSAQDRAVLAASNLVLDSSLRRIADENGGCLADWARAELERRIASI